jgi:hypothetical protein
MTYTDYTATAEITPGDRILRSTIAGDTEWTVLAVEPGRIQIAVPEAGQYLNNRNRTARTRWYKRTSPILAGAVIAR